MADQAPGSDAETRIAPEDRKARYEAARENLRASLLQTHVLEAERASFFRSHRAELGVRIRSGLVALNGGSAVALASVYGAVGAKALDEVGVTRPVVLFSLGLFLVGTWLAGWALNSQYNDAIHAEGYATVRSITLLRAASGINSLANEHNVEAAFDELDETPLLHPKHDRWAINFQSASWGCWGTGALALVLTVALTPISPWFERLFS